MAIDLLVPCLPGVCGLCGAGLLLDQRETTADSASIKVDARVHGSGKVGSVDQYQQAAACLAMEVAPGPLLESSLPRAERPSLRHRSMKPFRVGSADLFNRLRGVFREAASGIGAK
jgi:hypothetical protein